MIRIVFRNLSFHEGVELPGSAGPVSMTVEGHAGKGIRGSDPVCAAVSALAQTAVLGIRRIAGIEQDLSVRDGYLHTVFDTADLSPGKKGALKIILDLFCIGIFEILKEHEGAVSIDFDDIINKE